MKRFLIIFSFLLVLTFVPFTQTSLGQTPNGGVIFKIPDDVFPMDWNKSGFKGFLMLRKNSPSGLFICYPNDDEKIEDLKERAIKFIAPMVISDDNGGKDIKLEKNSIPKHDGDAGDAASYYSYANKKNMVQILLYDRISNGKPFIYGYFAMKGNDVKPESVKDIWADEKGEGVKIFEKFRKTLKEGKDSSNSKKNEG